MGKRKKHHYIPKFYLKRFSINYEGKTIGLYNYKSKIFIQNAPLKHQACEDYLYGTDDKVEADLAKLEGIIANFFNHWTDEKILIPPPEDTNGFHFLKIFILYQKYRTPQAGKDTELLMDQAFKAYLQVSNPEKYESYKDGKLVHENAALLSLLYAGDKVKLLNFLSCKFIVNLSELSFITSDSPIIMYNQLLEDKGIYTGATALVAKGLQIFYPIHPRLMICLFDPKIYNCGEDGKACASTEDVDDVHQLNTLQYLCSNSQMFFDETITQQYIEHIIEESKSDKKESRHFSEYIKTEDNRHFLFTSFEDPKINLELSFFKMRKDIEAFELELTPLRHPSLARDKINF